MGTIASQITSLTIVYSSVYSGADQRKHQSSASLAFVRGIHRGPVNFPHKRPVMRKMFPFDDVIMIVFVATSGFMDSPPHSDCAQWAFARLLIPFINLTRPWLSVHWQLKSGWEWCFFGPSRKKIMIHRLNDCSRAMSEICNWIPSLVDGSIFQSIVVVHHQVPLTCKI